MGILGSGKEKENIVEVMLTCPKYSLKHTLFKKKKFSQFFIMVILNVVLHGN